MSWMAVSTAVDTANDEILNDQTTAGEVRDILGRSSVKVAVGWNLEIADMFQHLLGAKFA